jgi:predicted aspartyl protease
MMLVKRPALEWPIAIAVSLGCATATLAPARGQARPGKEDERTERLMTDLRIGRYADADRLIEEMLRTEPRDDLKQVRAVFGHSPNMRVRRGSSTFACEVKDDGVLLPLSVNGRHVDWLVDTGANVSMMSDAEATRLGLVIRDTEGRVQNLAGGSAPVRRVIAQRVVIGRTELQDVLFLIGPADEIPWKEMSPGEQGIIGLPIVVGLDALRWSRDGVCQTGSMAQGAAAGSNPRNLAYDHLNVITRVEVDGRQLDFVLDTGNQSGTQFWERFGADFDALIRKRGSKATLRLAQVGGAADRDIVVVPDVRLKVGGKDTALARANVFSKPVGDDRFHGLLGMDILSQAAAVTIDLRSMTLILR